MTLNEKLDLLEVKAIKNCLAELEKRMQRVDAEMTRWGRNNIKNPSFTLAISEAKSTFEYVKYFLTHSGIHWRTVFDLGRVVGALGMAGGLTSLPKYHGYKSMEENDKLIEVLDDASSFAYELSNSIMRQIERDQR